MKKRIIIFLVCCLLLILDNSFIPFFSIKGAYPSLLFVFAIAYSIVNGKEEACFIGIVSGLLQDVFFFQGFGVNALINMIFCVIVAIIGEGIWREKKLVPIVTIFLATVLKYLGVMAIFYFLKLNNIISLSIGVYTALYNSLIMLFAYKVIWKLYNKDDIRTTWRT